jgi:prolyl-tRNA editing enzyme YbaK/EbsC (Cys-tRNA(Pro) deacylase)
MITLDRTPIVTGTTSRNRGPGADVARAKKVPAVTSFDVGRVPPFARPNPIQILIDPVLMGVAALKRVTGGPRTVSKSPTQT